MLTKINTYEGVPIGSKNFDDFFDYVREFLGANFNFSTYLSSENGGFFPKDSLEFILKGNPSSVSQSAFFFMSSVEETGEFFGKKDFEYYKTKHLGPKYSLPKTEVWELLPTKSSSDDASNVYVFENLSFEDKVLPYNPISIIESTDVDNIILNSYTITEQGAYTIYFDVQDENPQTFDVLIDGNPVGVQQQYEGGNTLSNIVFNLSFAQDNEISLSNTTGIINQIKIKPVDSVSQGYTYVSYNGVHQEKNVDYQPVIDSDTSNFRTQTLTIPRVIHGAESPKPLDENGRFFRDVIYGDESALGINLNELSSVFNNELEFNFTNFSLGGYIFLLRENSSTGERNFVYLTPDMSYSEETSLGKYKVKDFPSGKIHLNISETQLDKLVFANEDFSDFDDKKQNLRFFIISAEQLLVDSRERITNYRTRYGNVYTGQQDLVDVIELRSIGETFEINTEVSGVISSSGDNILRDETKQYENSVLLAIKYPAVPSLSEYKRIQNNRYTPDVFHLYYSPGISINPNSLNSVKGFIEQNDSSWYNKSFSDGSFYPVSRAVKTYLSFTTDEEISGSDFSSVITFDPTTVFSISDLLTLKQIGDVESIDGDSVFDGFDDQTILKYDSALEKFISTKYDLSSINDVNVSSATNNQVLTYNLTSGVWTAKNVGGANGALGYTPLNKAGDIISGSGGNPSNRLEYSLPMSYQDGLNNEPDRTLVTKQYVDEAIPGVVDGDYISGFDIDASSLNGRIADDFLTQPETTDDTLTINGNFEVTGDVTILGTTTISGFDADTLDGNDSTDFVFASEKGVADGIATLDGAGKLQQDQIPSLSLTETFVVNDNVERDALNAQEGDIAIVRSSSGLDYTVNTIAERDALSASAGETAKVLDNGATYIFDGSTWSITEEPLDVARTWIYSGTTWIELVVADTVFAVNEKVGFVELNTDDIEEGSENLYHTEQRVQDIITNRNDLVNSTDISNIISLTQAEYDALIPDPNTLYVITDE